MNADRADLPYDRPARAATSSPRPRGVKPAT